MTRATWQQLAGLLLLAIPIACIVRTMIFEEIFREPREWCKFRSQSCRRLVSRKFFYLFTCEYCFSHWVTAGALVFTAWGEGPGFRMLFTDWRGSVIAFFSLVFVANIYLNLYSRLRIELTSEKKVIEATEKEIAVKEKQLERLEAVSENAKAAAIDGRPIAQVESAG
jgi:hypothetical protein